MKTSSPISTVVDTTRIQRGCDLDPTNKATDSTAGTSDATASSSSSASATSHEENSLVAEENSLVAEEADPTTETGTGTETETEPCYALSNSIMARDQHQTLVLARLAKQLEYYFSEINLAKDTYLQTLRKLNDGCVPVSILATFSNVKLLLPVADDDVRIQFILQAACEHTELLRVTSIDARTGRLTTDETPSSAKTILAVGPVSTAPLPVAAAATTTATTAASTRDVPQETHPVVCNTVILRDVIAKVDQEQVRELFEQLQDCPAVTNIHKDVADCWFIKLDTTCRQEMLRVMMQLRSSALAGDPVHARLKATGSAPPNLAPPLPNAAWIPRLEGKKRKNKKRGKKKRGGAAVVASKVPIPAVVQPAAPADTDAATKRPLLLGEVDFPSLLDKHVEWETPLEEQDEDASGEEQTTSSKNGVSDVASTATTTSSSSSLLPIKQTTTVVGGYAAALLKSPVPLPSINAQASGVAVAAAVAVAADVAARRVDTVASKSSVAPNGKRREEPAVGPATVTKVSPWGGPRSFVDVCKSLV